MLKTVDIHTYYGDSYVLQGVSLEVTQGTVVALLGRNGVGKTTLIRSMIGFTPVRRGQFLFKGVDIAHMPSHKIWKMQMGLVPQGRRIFPSLTVKENLAITYRKLDGSQWDLEKIFDLFPRLRERQSHKGNAVSGGEQHAEIAFGVVHQLYGMIIPRLVFFQRPLFYRSAFSGKFGDIILRFYGKGVFTSVS